MTDLEISDLITRQNEEYCLDILSKFTGSYNVVNALNLAAAKGYSGLCSFLAKQIPHSKEAAYKPVVNAIHIALRGGLFDTAVVLLKEIGTDYESRKLSLSLACSTGNFDVICHLFYYLSMIYDGESIALLELIESSEKVVSNTEDYKRISQLLSSGKLSIQQRLSISTLVTDSVELSEAWGDYSL